MPSSARTEDSRCAATLGARGAGRRTGGNENGGFLLRVGGSLQRHGNQGFARIAGGENEACRGYRCADDYYGESWLPATASRRRRDTRHGATGAARDRIA